VKTSRRAVDGFDDCFFSFGFLVPVFTGQPITQSRNAVQMVAILMSLPFSESAAWYSLRLVGLADNREGWTEGDAIDGISEGDRKPMFLTPHLPALDILGLAFLNALPIVVASFLAVPSLAPSLSMDVLSFPIIYCKSTLNGDEVTIERRRSTVESSSRGDCLWVCVRRLLISCRRSCCRDVVWSANLRA